MAAADASIGEAAIHPAQYRQRFGEGGVHGGAVAHVHGLDQHPAAGGFQPCAGGVVLDGVLAPDGHIGAGLGHRFGHCQANATIAAGDQRHLARQIKAFECHLVTSPTGRRIAAGFVAQLARGSGTGQIEGN